MIFAAYLLTLAPGVAEVPSLPGGSVEDGSRVLVQPDHVRLEGARDRQRLLVLEITADGRTLDRTDDASFTLLDAEHATVTASQGSVLVAPLADGETTLSIVVGDRQIEVPVEVLDAEVAPPPSFRLDVLPVLTANGCNVGSCHGSARGQDGFHLSLFGFDPAGDHLRLTSERPGRRLDLAFPRTSLILEKATGAVAHTGGRLFGPESDAYATLLRWIDAGASDEWKELAVVEGIELFPAEVVALGPDSTMRLVVRARYSDGSDRDVTDLALLRTSNEVSAALEPGGVLRSGGPGEAYVTASFGVYTVGMPVVVLDEDAPSELVDPAPADWPSNWIDELVAAKHRRLRIAPSPIAGDEVFLRRVYLDVVGVPPTPDDRAAFLADDRPSPAKRAALVDELLARKEFTDQWVMRWAELLRIRSTDTIDVKAARLYFDWVRERVAENTPVDEIVRRLLTASGGTFAAPETNFYQVERDNLVLAENVAQAFLGIRVQCAQCHNHPFDRWTQDDYYGFAAFFAQVGRKGAEDPREQVVFDRRGGETSHPVDKRKMAPKFLGGATPDVQGKDRRAVLAEWLTAPDNPWFARTLANRVWASFFGPGIIEPVDDFRVSNPPSNGPLLDALAAHLVETGYDFRALVRDILTSRAYQRSTDASPANAADERNFARAQVRRLRAETLFDTICQATGAPEKFSGLPLGARAVEIADGATGNYFLRTFGRAPRTSVCACDVSDSPSLSQALHLLNGETIEDKIRAGGVVGELLAQDLSAGEVIDALYLRSLTRLPDDVERAMLVDRVEAANDPRMALEDVFWALLNSREFLFQH